MESACWETCATDSIIRSGQKDTEASITTVFFIATKQMSSCFKSLQETDFKVIRAHLMPELVFFYPL